MHASAHVNLGFVPIPGRLWPPGQHELFGRQGRLRGWRFVATTDRCGSAAGLREDDFDAADPPVELHAPVDHRVRRVRPLLSLVDGSCAAAVGSDTTPATPCNGIDKSVRCFDDLANTRDRPAVHRPEHVRSRCRRFILASAHPGRLAACGSGKTADAADGMSWQRFEQQLVGEG